MSGNPARGIYSVHRGPETTSHTCQRASHKNKIKHSGQAIKLHQTIVNYNLQAQAEQDPRPRPDSALPHHKEWHGSNVDPNNGMISNNFWICRCRISARLTALADLHKQHCQHRLCIGSCHGDMLSTYAFMLRHAMAQLLHKVAYICTGRCHSARSMNMPRPA